MGEISLLRDWLMLYWCCWCHLCVVELPGALLRLLLGVLLAIVVSGALVLLLLRADLLLLLVVVGSLTANAEFLFPCDYIETCLLPLRM